MSSTLNNFISSSILHDQFVILDEWENFLERIKSTADAVEDNDNLELRFWASYRGQTLARTGYCVSLLPELPVGNRLLFSPLFL